MFANVTFRQNWTSLVHASCKPVLFLVLISISIIYNNKSRVYPNLYLKCPYAHCCKAHVPDAIILSGSLIPSAWNLLSQSQSCHLGVVTLFCQANYCKLTLYLFLSKDIFTEFALFYTGIHIHINKMFADLNNYSKCYSIWIVLGSWYSPYKRSIFTGCQTYRFPS